MFCSNTAKHIIVVNNYENLSSNTLSNDENNFLVRMFSKSSQYFLDTSKRY
jgi:hypothetical protein